MTEGDGSFVDETNRCPATPTFALRVASVEATMGTLAALGVGVTEGPVRLGDGLSIFVRDPDRNVIELRE